MVKTKEKEGIPVFFLDDSVLLSMFNGKGTEDEMFNRLAEMRKEGMPFKAVVILPSLLRALWKSDPEMKLKKIQRVLDIIDVMPYPSPVDYKDENKVRTSVIKSANALASMEK